MKNQDVAKILVAAQSQSFIQFLRATAATAVVHLSYRNFVHLSVCLFVCLSHEWIIQKMVQARITKSSQSAA